MNEYKLERILKSLANKRRLAILKYLKKNREASVGEIAGAIHLSLKATSKHLGVLAATDIVVRDQRSMQMFYSISKELHVCARQIVHLL